MSGHSKWANIQHRKGAQDAKKGKVFTKLIKEILVAARMGGADPNSNNRLRAAIAAAKTVNMPKDNIERAIKKGTGELEGVNYEEINYEGYGPGGVAVLVEAMTDNRTRTVAEVRHIFSKRGGNMGEPGSVAWMFSKKGVITVDKAKADEDTLLSVVLDAGAEDMKDEGEQWEIHTEPSVFEDVKQALEANSIAFSSAEITMLPTTTVEVTDEETASKLLKMMDALDDNDDVQHVHANFDIPDAIMEKLG